ncbi:MAG: hypothetical protein AB1896_01145 [Thermodesulfobacteriota bacterium]
MTPLLDRLAFLPPLAGVDREYLSGVQRSFGSSGVMVGLQILGLLFLLMLVLILIVLLLRLIFRPAQQKFGPGKVDEIRNPNEINKIIHKSIDLRAIYEMEVFNRNYKEIYRGQVLGVNQDGQIEVELTTFLDPNLDFKDQEVRVNFRMSRRGQVEFYQFDTLSRYIGVTKSYGRREKAVRLDGPQMVERGQKRRHLRVRPVGRFSFKVDLIQPQVPANPIPLGGFRRLHQAEVNDVSVGGMQLIIEARTSEIKVQPGEETYVHFKPPLAGLHVEGLPRNYFAKAKVISVLRLTSGRRVMSSEADLMTVGPNQIRLQFIGKGTLNEKEKNVSFRPATTLAFEDFSRWIQAYQRYRIQEEKGTLPKPSKVQNIYPSRKPEVEPKYPSKPPSFKPTES